MAIYHLCIKIISRGKGKSAVVASAYRSGEKIKPQLFTPNLKTIQNPCLSLDPGWFLFSPNGCF
ncbi:hypothetical protein RRB44_03120, partial [Streptococcus pneumoniae]|nr:hypothetical protein [Streptococcus pneumoniae]